MAVAAFLKPTEAVGLGPGFYFHCWSSHWSRSRQSIRNPIARPNPLGALHRAGSDYGAVDHYYLSFGVDEWPAGVARVVDDVGTVKV